MLDGITAGQFRRVDTGIVPESEARFLPQNPEPPGRATGLYPPSPEGDVTLARLDAGNFLNLGYFCTGILAAPRLFHTKLAQPGSHIRSYSHTFRVL